MWIRFQKTASPNERRGCLNPVSAKLYSGIGGNHGAAGITSQSPAFPPSGNGVSIPQYGGKKSLTGFVNPKCPITLWYSFQKSHH
ncbi:MAG: hypothetical protein AAGJ83_05465 [Planctomycetota bacterium]